jgi:hypothetical protein
MGPYVEVMLAVFFRHGFSWVNFFPTSLPPKLGLKILHANLIELLTPVSYFSGAPLYGRLLALPTNIRQGLPGTNAIGHYENL